MILYTAIFFNGYTGNTTQHLFITTGSLGRSISLSISRGMIPTCWSIAL